VAATGRISQADFLKPASSSDQLLPYKKGIRNVSFPTEGFLFPDTYFIPYDATADDVVAMMLKNFDAHLTDAMKAGIAKQNLSIYQFVTLASLIEKEAKYEKDRPLIASVFENRLKIHMKLQSDASISYAMGTHKAAYSINETQYDSPYNTYRYEGLPPGPIGNPGMDCMEAILEAPQTNYLYFVADKDGHNYFAATYKEHMKNVQEHMP
ncbi:endolytic transglycosylase MltG, partial [Megasphaera sp.]|uniref:endolytic transglycosylase MltG n=1 Tax=Megasphaera sp. TaxID=2023260 RepID=UPI0040284203